jgi:flagellar basal body-associated protein FliL
MSYQEEEPSPTVPKASMTLFMISIPLMVLAVALAVVPLIVVSRADHRRRQDEATHRRDPVPVEPARVDEEAAPMAA